MNKPIIFSGMQATGEPHIGSYLGAIRHWAAMQDAGRCLYCIVDLHSLTVRQDPAEFRANARKLMALYIALGLDPERSLIYFQSHVSAHAELAWILNCFTYVGELNRMTQFKDKSSKHEDNINAGLYTYPVLQAADILLYKTNYVPIGEDQKQHLEICRDIAVRFNQRYGDIFVIPEPRIATVGARIMGLQTPNRKMSKSEAENVNNLVYLLDEPDTIMRKFKRAVTDTGSEIRYAPDEKPGISNLLAIYACVTGRSIPDCEKEFVGAGYGTFKMAVGEAVAAMLAPARARYKELAADQAALDAQAAKHAAAARQLAEETLSEVKYALGLNG